MNPTAKSGRIFSFYRFSGTAANLLWTLGWTAAAVLAIGRWCNTHESADLINAFAILIPALLGCVMTRRAFPRANAREVLKDYPKESLASRIVGWLASLVWGAFAALWNIVVLRVLLHAAQDGSTVNVLFMIPFSLIGWMLLVALCVMITMVLDSLIEIIRGASHSSQSRSGVDG